MEAKEEKIKNILGENVVSEINNFKKIYYENYYKKNKWKIYNEAIKKVKEELNKIDRDLILKFEKRAVSTRLKEWTGWKIINQKNKKEIQRRFSYYNGYIYALIINFEKSNKIKKVVDNI